MKRNLIVFSEACC